MARKLQKTGLPPLDWLKVFEAAGRHGSFTAAAEEFGSTQAAVSQRIRNLETWLGRQLFIRSARGVSLTVDGESYLPLVHETLRTLELGTETLFGHSPRELRIAALPSHFEALVLPRLGRFAESHPELKLVLETVPKRSEFDSGDNAVHIRYGRGEWAGREAALLAREVLQPMADRPVADWQALPAIDLRSERPGWSDWARVTGGKAPPGGQISVDSMIHALQAAYLGQGVVLGSKVMARDMLETGRLSLLDAPEMVTVDGYWLTWPSSMGKSRRQKDLLLALAAALSAGESL